MNNRYTIVDRDPLLRPGLCISTEVSERYVVPVLQQMLAMIREINTTEPPHD